MLRRMFVLGVGLLVCAETSFALGTVENRTFYSQALGEDRNVQVYLPEGYDPAGQIYYPAIYFLHGNNQSFTSYGTLITALDVLIGNGQIHPVIVLKPDGNRPAGQWGGNYGCWWSSSDLYGHVQESVVEDLVNWAESQYRIEPGRSHRAIMGHSAGGAGAFLAAYSHPELFKALASHSGYPYHQDFQDWIPYVLHENGHPPYNYSPGAGLYTDLFFELSGAFSADLPNLPYRVDFPLDEQGSIIPDVWARWMARNPAYLAESLTPDTVPDTYFDVGTEDEYGGLPFNQHLSSRLTELGLPHHFETFHGDHWNMLPQRFLVSLVFLDQALHGLSSVDQPDALRGVPVTLCTSFPNPVGSHATFRFATGEPGRVELRLFDAQGRMVRTLLNQVFASGQHEVGWTTYGIHPGVYFYRLQAGRRTAGGRVVIKGAVDNSTGE